MREKYLFAVIFIGCFLVDKVTGMLHMDVSGKLKQLETLNAGAVIIILLLILAAITFISMKISVKILNQKEF